MHDQAQTSQSYSSASHEITALFVTAIGWPGTCLVSLSGPADRLGDTREPVRSVYSPSEISSYPNNNDNRLTFCDLRANPPVPQTGRQEA
jgi:hypothetical protein